MSTEDRVRHVLSVILKIDLPEGQDLRREDEPKWDSLKHVEIVFALEDEFDVQFDEERMASLTSLGAIVAALENPHAA
ncbi:MAG: acyl carrier protein [Acidihalobacter sp.]|jgi:acyl carrier protein|uniref:acyl carrier protein n=1 Tax=Acidihalobacter sp. TaxID=1872108 RepID=UPI00307E5AFA